MPKLSIDNRSVEVPEGATLLEAAAMAGVEVPTLCHFPGCSPQSSCLVCIVKLNDADRLVPACATPARDGDIVETGSEDVLAARRTAFELLLSDHVGSCLAPCHTACPAHMDIPTMIRQIAASDLRGAIETVKRDIPLPAALGRVCSAPCEAGCTRRPTGGAVAVCLLKRFVADQDLASSEPWLPRRMPATGRRVAVVGAGACGLSAAYYLQVAGHACTVFDERDEPGGRLRYAMSPHILPRAVLDGEIDIIRRLGARFVMNRRLGEDMDLIDLRRAHDAVLVTLGSFDEEMIGRLELATNADGVAVDEMTGETSMPGVFAAGLARRHSWVAVRSVAEGRIAATRIDRHLRGTRPEASRRPFSVKTARRALQQSRPSEVGASDASRVSPHAGLARGFGVAEALEEARRCMQCACAGASDCRLRRFAADCGARTSAFHGAARMLARHRRMGEVLYDPGKCISCGLCVEITSGCAEVPGMTHVGRGFDVRIDVPFDGSLDEALGEAAGKCVRACPTAALRFAGDTCGCVVDGCPAQALCDAGDSIPEAPDSEGLRADRASKTIPDP